MGATRVADRTDRHRERAFRRIGYLNLDVRLREAAGVLQRVLQ